MRAKWSRFIGWFERRLELKSTIGPLLRHPVPRGVNWWYVFGSATLTFFAVQVVTGVILAAFYVPSAEGAYGSLQNLNDHVTLGWLVRAIHNVSASGMIVMIGVHMTQVFLFGAYKYPRELTWLVGGVLFLLTLVMGFSGQILRWDASAYWGVSVLASMVGRVPWIGPFIIRLVLGGSYIGGDTVTRFFSVHVFIVPAVLIGAVGLHLYLVVKRGISEPPKPGETVDPATYDARYEALLEKGEPFYPRAFWKDGISRRSWCSRSWGSPWCWAPPARGRRPTRASCRPSRDPIGTFCPSSRSSRWCRRRGRRSSCWRCPWC